MNTRQKISFASSLAVILAAAAAWAATGFNVFTKQQIPIEQIDEFFGTKTIVWKSVFMIGLDIAAPVALFALLAGAVLTYMFRTRPAR